MTTIEELINSKYLLNSKVKKFKEIQKIIYDYDPLEDLLAEFDIERYTSELSALRTNILKLRVVTSLFDMLKSELQSNDETH